MTNGNEWFLTYLTYLGNRGHGDIMQKRDVLIIRISISI